MKLFCFWCDGTFNDINDLIIFFLALYRPQSIAFFSFDLYFVSRAAVSAF